MVRKSGISKTDWSELFMLTRQAEGALLSGQLTETQSAIATTFLSLGMHVLDLNERLAEIETTGVAIADDAADKPLVISSENING